MRGWGYGRGLGILIVLLIYGIYYLLKHYLIYVIIFIVGLVIYLIYRHSNKNYNYASNNYKVDNAPYVDENGYERNVYGRLIHRDVAYKYIYRKGYKDGIFTKRFGYYDIHHIDGDKRNNSIDNLQILTREEHKAKHGIKQKD